MDSRVTIRSAIFQAAADAEIQFARAGAIMKIACVSVFDPRNIASWSGCSYYLTEALIANSSASLSFIGPLDQKHSLQFRCKELIYRKLLGRNYLPTVDPAALEHYARQCAHNLQGLTPDVILSLGALPIAHLDTNIPIVYYWDCTFLGNLEYPWFGKLAPECIANGHKMEQLALEKCRVAVYSSEWATQTAIAGYKADPSKLRVVPLAANLRRERTLNDAKRLVAARKSKVCNLLFMGIDWIRKGGDVAYQVAKELNARGLDTTLSIVGCAPQVSETVPQFVKCFGFLNKNDNDDATKINDLLEQSHFLVVPSLAESFGAVFCEASSYAIPSIARRVGGIPSAVTNDVNGQLFDKDAPISEYCDFVMETFNDYARYSALALSAFAEYEDRLNWDKSAEALLEICRTILIDHQFSGR